MKTEHEHTATGPGPFTSLPADFVAAGLNMAEGMLLFGIRLDQLTREELLAAAAQGWNAEKRARDASFERSRAMSEFFKKGR